MRIAILLLSVTALSMSTGATKPTAIPLASTDGSGFLIRATNTRSENLAVTPEGLCGRRFDGVEDRTGFGGSGGAVIVKPGEQWEEAVKFVATPRPSGPRPMNPLKGTAAGYLELAVNLTPGRHTVAFKCAGSEWSDDQEFYWLGK